jgi:tetratricopeptide (TPR) repeat protein
MAPEQLDRERLVTAAADQYAFCISLREALEANGGVPAWIATIIERGTRADPAARYPQLADLLAALARDPATRWRRRAVFGAIVLAAALTFVITRKTSESNTVEPCIGGADEIARVYDASTSKRIAEHVKQVDARREADGIQLVGELARDAKSWANEHRATCLANLRKELTPAQHAARVGCLARTRAQLASIVDLMSRVDERGLDNALFAARQRSDVVGCASPDERIAPPPAGLAPQIAELVPQIERALVLATAFEDAVNIAAEGVKRARATAYRPLLARALLVYGRALEVRGRKPAVAEAYDEARTTALESLDFETAVEAFARAVWTRGTASDETVAVMMPLANSLEMRGRFVRALLYNNLALAAPDIAQANELLRRAKLEAAGTSEIELTAIDTNIAVRAPTPELALARLHGVHERYRRALGAMHGKTMTALGRIALLTADRTVARTTMHCEQQPPAQRDLCRYEAAWIADEDGDITEAVKLMETVSEVETVIDDGDKDDAIEVVARAYVSMRAQRMTSEQRQALERLASKPSGLNKHRFAADAALILALASPADIAAWERAHQRAVEHNTVMIARRLARIDAALALGGGADAEGHARRALGWYRASQHDDALIARLEQLTGSSSR